MAKQSSKQATQYITGSPIDIVSKLREEVETLCEDNMEFMKMMVDPPNPGVGISPKETIWTKNKSKLYHYKPQAPSNGKPPILFFYALINKPYIVDIYPGTSLVEHLLKQGFDVYLFDWGDWAWEDRYLKYEDFIFDYMHQAVKRVLRFSKAKELTIIGYCMGGTMTAMYTSLFQDKMPIKNLVFLTTPFDFADTGLFNKFCAEQNYDVDKVVDTFGMIPPEFIDFGNKMLKPVDNFVSNYTRLWKNMRNPKFIEAWSVLNYWLRDGSWFPGEAFRQWIKDLYQKNKLMKGELKLRGEVCDLKNITANTCIVIGELDHIALPHQSRAGYEAISSKDKTILSLPLGHVGIVFGAGAVRQFYPAITKWLMEH